MVAKVESAVAMFTASLRRLSGGAQLCAAVYQQRLSALVRSRSPV